MCSIPWVRSEQVDRLFHASKATLGIFHLFDSFFLFFNEKCKVETRLWTYINKNIQYVQIGSRIAVWLSPVLLILTMLPPCALFHLLLLLAVIDLGTEMISSKRMHYSWSHSLAVLWILKPLKASHLSRVAVKAPQRRLPIIANDDFFFSNVYVWVYIYTVYYILISRLHKESQQIITLRVFSQSFFTVCWALASRHVVAAGGELVICYAACQT